MYIHRTKFEKVDITKIDQLRVWQYILGLNVELNQRFVTTLRPDNTADCKLKEINGFVYYYDKPGKYLHEHNCFNAWMEINNVTYGKAIKEITEKINGVKADKPIVRKVTKPNKVEIIPIPMKWTKPAVNWFKAYGITDLTNILNLSGVIMNEQQIAFTKLTFAYIYNTLVDGTVLAESDWQYKIYSPKCVSNGVEYKSSFMGSVKGDMTWFVDNRNKDVSSLCSVDTQSKPKLFFCKSAKCQKVLQSLLGTEYSYIHPQSEGTLTKYPHLELLKDFNVTILLDNDETGVLMSQKFSELLTKNNIENKQLFCVGHKDISDFRKSEGEEKTIAFLRSIGV